MSPAGSTVLGNVLVQGVGQVADAVDIAPVKIVRQMRRLHILMRQGTRVVVVDSIVADLRRVLERRMGKTGGTTNVQRPSKRPGQRVGDLHLLSGIPPQRQLLRHSP